MINLLDLIDENILIEAGYEYVVRNRKKIRKKKKKSGYKIVNGKYKKMTAKEKMKRKRGQIKAAKKRKAKRSQIKRKRKLSLQKRKSFGLR